MLGLYCVYKNTNRVFVCVEGRWGWFPYFVCKDYKLLFSPACLCAANVVNTMTVWSSGNLIKNETLWTPCLRQNCRTLHCVLFILTHSKHLLCWEQATPLRRHSFQTQESFVSAATHYISLICGTSHEAGAGSLHSTEWAPCRTWWIKRKHGVEHQQD